VARRCTRGKRVAPVCRIACLLLLGTVSSAAAQSFELRVSGFGDGDGLVTSSPSGISCTFVDITKTGTCVATFAAGTIVTLAASPASGGTVGNWAFVFGSGTGCTTGSATCQTTVDKFTEVQITFVPARYPLTVIPAGTGYGVILGERANGFFGQQNLSCGVNVPNPELSICTVMHAVNKRIRLGTNLPSTNNWSQFMGFSAPCVDQTCGAIMPAAPLSIVATVDAPGFRIVGGAGGGSGRVVKTAGTPPIDCNVTPSGSTGTCSQTYTLQNPSLVTLSATPSPGSMFVGWSGAGCSGTGACQFFIPVQPAVITEIVANFAPASAVLTVSGAGSGGGSVVSTPSGISCAITAGSPTGICIKAFDGGTIVSLQATPNAGSTFAGWSGSCTGTAGCAITLNAGQSVTARFTAITPTVAVTGSGSGNIASTPAGITCALTNGAASGACSAPFGFGSSVTLVATPTAGWTFAGWGGACTGTGSCALNATEDRAVSASFARATVTLKVTGAGNGDGLVTASAVGLTCAIAKGGGNDATCTTLVAEGVAVTLMADPNGGSVFGGWSGDVCSGNTLICTLTVSQVRNVVARFNAPRAGRDIAQALLTGSTLAADELEQLDRFGNKDGTFNLGDLLALLNRTGERLTPATTAALLQADRRDSSTPAANTRRTP
jgi:hypothetical protein